LKKFWTTMIFIQRYWASDWSRKQSTRMNRACITCSMPIIKGHQEQTSHFLKSASHPNIRPVQIPYHEPSSEFLHWKHWNISKSVFRKRRYILKAPSKGSVTHI